MKLRWDDGRVILFSVNWADSTKEDCFRFLLPQEAVILSLFDGSRDLASIAESVAYLFSLEVKQASRQVEDLLALSVSPKETIGSLIVESAGIDPIMVQTYDPRNFIAPADSIDMSDARCKIPFRLLILTTMRCITSCRYCYADREAFRGKPEFGLMLFKRLIREAKECGIEAIQFSGGDIFCRRDAFDLIESTLSAGMYANIPTKYPLSSSQVERLSRLGLSTIQISIDALNPDVIDTMVARHGYGKKILQTLGYLGEAGIRVRTNTVLTPYNIRDAPDLARYLAEKSYVFKCNFTCYVRSHYRHDDSMFCSPTEVHEFERGFNRVRNEFPHKAMFFSSPPVNPYMGGEIERAKAFGQRSRCTASRQGVVVLPDGRVTVCEELYDNEHFIIGDLSKQTLMEIWNSPRALEIAHPVQGSVPDGACRDCLDFHACHDGLGTCYRETIKAYGGRRWYWPDPRCPHAPIGKRLA